jgi:hypothetical protein
MRHSALEIFDMLARTDSSWLSSHFRKSQAGAGREERFISAACAIVVDLAQETHQNQRPFRSIRKLPRQADTSKRDCLAD